MRQTILGKVYEMVDQTEKQLLSEDSCEGCAFQFAIDGCIEPNSDDCVDNEDMVWKEVEQ